jgi:hypothetical protein
MEGRTGSELGEESVERAEHVLAHGARVQEELIEHQQLIWEGHLGREEW